jgi:S-formylglutathione hydrolase
MTLTLISEQKCFSGYQKIFSHHSTATKSQMRFAIYLPPHDNKNLPVLYWLSGLTCTEENFITKAGAQRVAAELGLIIVVPDTSPRGLNIPGENDSYDFGTGAGFYLDAVVEPWAQYYRMYSYITQELTKLINDNFPVDPHRTGIFGHSMGGHGALTIAIKNPAIFKSVSAFAPICAPMQSVWGKKAFTGYLGEDQTLWQHYDATALIKTLGWQGPEILIDQGTADEHYKDGKLNPGSFAKACEIAGVKLQLRLQEGYDHGYYFISTFIEDHLRFHFSNLSNKIN